MCTFKEGKESSTPRALWLQTRQTAPPPSAVRKQGGLPACKLEEHSPLPQECAPSLGHPGVLPATEWPEFQARHFLEEQLQEEKLPGGLVTAPDDVVSAGSGHWFVLEMSCLW